MEDQLICAFFWGDAGTEEKSTKLAQRYQACPYIYFIAKRSKEVFAIFFLPAKQRWWIEGIAEKPRETLGVERAEVTIMDAIQYPQSLSIRLPEIPQEIAPCGSNCHVCQVYEKCTGCPATTFYKQT